MNIYIEAGILQIPSYTGCQVYTYNILAEMAALSPETNFHLHFAMGGWHPQIDQLLTQHNIIPHRFRGATGRHLAQSVNILRTKSRVLYFMNGYAGRLRVPVTCPTVALLHDMRHALHREIYGDAVCDAFVATTKKWISGCECIITPTETVKQELADFFRIPLERIVVSSEATDHHPRHAISYRPVSLPKGNYPIFLMVNPGEARKNWQDVFSAFALFIRQYPKEKEVMLVVAGGLGTEDKKLQERLKSDPLLAKRTILTGYVRDEELRWLYQNARFLLFLSRYEGFGIPTLEAMEQNTPIILSDIPVFREVAKEAARFVSLDKPREIADAMYEMHTDGILRQEFIARGRRRVADFSWRKSAGITLSVLQNLAMK